jgi:transposase
MLVTVLSWPELAPRNRMRRYRMQDPVVAGVDTHRDSHVACVLAESGAKLGTRRFMADEAGYGELVGWVGSFGTITVVGVEGTGSWGAGLTRTLLARGIAVVEINQCNRGVRRLRGKDDAIDAESAARAVLAGTHAGAPKRRDGAVEAIRALRVARCGAIKARTASVNQIRSLIASSPEAVRAPLRQLKTAAMITACSRFRIRAERSGDAREGTRAALRSVARRYIELDHEAAILEKQISVLVREVAPALVMLLGVGPDHAGQFLVTAGDNPDRLRCEASFAALCGVAPVPASSGVTNRHRLSRGGDRQANRALHLIAVCRLRYCERTIAYAERRTAEGLSKKDILRCLKRYIAREVYAALPSSA